MNRSTAILTTLLAMGIALANGSPARAIDSRYWQQQCAIGLAENGLWEIETIPFRGSDRFTRAGFAAIVSEVFPDAPSEFLAGYPDGESRPNQIISRVDAIVAIANGLGYTEAYIDADNSDRAAIVDARNAVDDAFADSDRLPDYAIIPLAAALENEIVVSESSPPQLNPDRDATRADIAAIFCQVFQEDLPELAAPSQYVVETGTLRGLQVEERNAFGGAIQAVLSYNKRNYTYQDLRLQAVRQGQEFIDTVLPSPSGTNRDLEFYLTDLDGDRDPEIIVDWRSQPEGECCSNTLVYRYLNQQQRYDIRELNWDRVPYELRDLDGDGLPEFDSFDRSFIPDNISTTQMFLPKRIWQYRQGQVFETTRRFPERVRQNADRLWQEYQRRSCNDPEIPAILAAYLADRHTLGQAATAWRQVQEAYCGDDRDRFFSDLGQQLRSRGYRY